MENILALDQSAASEIEADGSELIESYATELASAATSDRVMAARLREEILDHLTEAYADAFGNPETCARQAIARFGSINEIAEGYRVAIMESCSRKLRWIVILAICMVFAVMRMRGLVFEPGWRDDVVSNIWGAIVMGIDRYGFAIASMIVLCILLIEWRGSARSPDTAFPRRGIMTGRGFMLTIVPAVLILFSALAGIGSLFFSDSFAQTPAFVSVLPQSIIILALLSICYAVLLGILKVTQSYLQIRGLSAGRRANTSIMS